MFSFAKIFYCVFVCIFSLSIKLRSPNSRTFYAIAAAAAAATATARSNAATAAADVADVLLYWNKVFFFFCFHFLTT